MAQLEIICKQCGNTFLVYPYRIKAGVSVCSLKCKNIIMNKGDEHRKKMNCLRSAKYRANHEMKYDPEKAKKRYEANKEDILKKKKDRYDPEKAKVYQDKNKEKRAEYLKPYNKVYAQKNSKKIAEYKKEWAFRNKERLSEARKKYYDENKSTIQLKVEAYRKTPHGRISKLNSGNKRRKKIRDKNSDVTTKFLLKLKKETPNCVICDVKLTDIIGLDNSRHLDHIVPLNVGGLHLQNNIRFTCQKCNLTRPKDGKDVYI